MRDDADRALAAELLALRRLQGVPSEGPDDLTEEEILVALGGHRGGGLDPEQLSPLSRDRLGILTAALDAEAEAAEAVAVATEITALQVGEARPAGSVGGEVPSSGEIRPPGSVSLGRPASAVVAPVVRWVFALGRETLSFLRGDTLPLMAAGAATVRNGASAAAGTLSGAGDPPEGVGKPPTYWELEAYLGDLEIQVAVDRALDRVDLRLAASCGGLAATDVRATLLADERIIASVPSDLHGAMVLAVPRPGRYVVEVQRQGAVAGRLALDLLDAR